MAHKGKSPFASAEQQGSPKPGRFRSFATSMSSLGRKLSVAASPFDDSEAKPKASLLRRFSVQEAKARPTSTASGAAAASSWSLRRSSDAPTRKSLGNIQENQVPEDCCLDGEEEGRPSQLSLGRRFLARVSSLPKATPTPPMSPTSKPTNAHSMDGFPGGQQLRQLHQTQRALGTNSMPSALAHATQDAPQQAARGPPNLRRGGYYLGLVGDYRHNNSCAAVHGGACQQLCAEAQRQQDEEDAQQSEQLAGWLKESRAPWSKHSARLKHMRCQELKQQHEVGADVSHLQF